MSVRKPAVSGQFYEDDFSRLNKQIESCFLHDLGPGELPEHRKDKHLLGIIVPHAGYAFSGPCAAWAYKEIAESRFADTYIIIGPNHHGTGGSSISMQDWETPLGMLYTDKAFAEHIAKQNNLSFAEGPHMDEHAIEVQLPFLQFAAKDKLGKLKIVAISLGSDMDLQKIQALASAIKTAAHELNRTYILIASSDFMHFGPDYNNEPFVYNIKDNINYINNEAFAIIKEKTASDLLGFVRKKEPSICGAQAIAVLMELAKDTAETKVMLQYYTSDSLTHDATNSVGYASFFFR